MYGRANPKPIPPSYDADDMRAMRAAEERAALEARASATGARAAASSPAARKTSRARRAERLWTSLVVPELMGLDLDLYKWRQNQARHSRCHARRSGCNARASVIRPAANAPARRALWIAGRPARRRA